MCLLLLSVALLVRPRDFSLHDSTRYSLFRSNEATALAAPCCSLCRFADALPLFIYKLCLRNTTQQQLTNNCFVNTLTLTHDRFFFLVFPRPSHLRSNVFPLNNVLWRSAVCVCVWSCGESLLYTNVWKWMWASVFAKAAIAGAIKFYWTCSCTT